MNLRRLKFWSRRQKQKENQGLDKKITVVFVCNRPQLWGSLKTLYDELVRDSLFNPMIVAIPTKKQLPQKGLEHDEYIDEGAYEFFKKISNNALNGYDEKNKKWLDLKTLSPQYLFFQTPYNITRPPQYHSKTVAKYTKLCYMHYGMLVFKGEVEDSIYQQDFFNDLSLIFAENVNYKKKYWDRIKSVRGSLENNIIVSGYPRFDELEKYKDSESKIWKFSRSQNKFRLIWTPRWCVSESNCHFFDYKNKIIEYAKSNPDIELVFRPHPQAFLEYIASGNMSEQEVMQCKLYFNTANSSIDEEKEYLATFYSSDALIADITSLMPEYLLTGKPIIYCHKTNHFNDFGQKLSEGFYWAKNWQELRETIDMIKSGNDPLKSKRSEIISQEFYFQPGGAGNYIKESLKKDFQQQNNRKWSF